MRRPVLSESAPSTRAIPSSPSAPRLNISGSGTTTVFLPIPRSMRLPTPGRWYEMAALLNGASCLAWITLLLGITSLETALKEAGQSLSSPSSLLFLPYLAGERTPLNDSTLRAMLLGVSHTTSSNRSSPRRPRRRRPRPCRRANLLGQPWLADRHHRRRCPQLTVGTNHRRCSRPRTRVYREAAAAAAFGAARLARMASTGETVNSICMKPPSLKRLKPRPAAHERYRRRLDLFGKPRLRCRLPRLIRIRREPDNAPRRFCPC